MTVDVWTIIATQIATWVTLMLFVSNRLDAQSRELRREFREQMGALTARFDAHLERHAR